MCYQQQRSCPQSGSLLRAAKPQRPGPGPAVGATRPRPSLKGSATRISSGSSSRCPIEPRLTVSPPSDAFEQEAERVADQVMSMPIPAPSAAGPVAGGAQAGPAIHRLGNSIRRAPADTKDEKKKPDAAPQAGPEATQAGPRVEEEGRRQGQTPAREGQEQEKGRRQGQTPARPRRGEKKNEDYGADPVQRAAESPGSVPSVSPALEQTLDSRRGAGQPLPGDVRSFFEPRFGQDLSGVRLHTDPQAADAARDLKAQAFTRGQDVYFGPGQYQPQSDRGRHLLAHELTHTVQQSPGAAAAPAVAPLGMQRAPDPSILHRQGDPAPAPTTPAASTAPGQTASPPTDPATGALDTTTETITFDKIEIPGFKLADHRGCPYSSHLPLKQKKHYQRGNPDQRAFWKAEMGKNPGKIVERLAALQGEECRPGGRPVADLHLPVRRPQR